MVGASTNAEDPVNSVPSTELVNPDGGEDDEWDSDQEPIRPEYVILVIIQENLVLRLKMFLASDLVEESNLQWLVAKVMSEVGQDDEL